MRTSYELLVAGSVLAAAIAGFSQPVIINQPQSCTNVLGTTVTFTVGAIGTEPLAYQWQKLSPAWSDLGGYTAANLYLTNVQTSHAGDYRVVIANVDGANTSDVARLTVVLPPRIIPSTLLQHTAVQIGTNASFAVTVSGTPPFSYKWRVDGRELLGQTRSTLAITIAQPADEGDYTVAVTNLAGAVISEPARLWVVPPASAFIKGNYTDGLGRLPYFYLLPTNYNATRTYPLWFNFHGIGYNEDGITNSLNGWAGVAEASGLKTFASYRQQERDPVIILWPTRRAGDGSWTDTYISQASAMLDQFIVQFSVDTNRIFIFGHSEGVHAAWDSVARRPGRFAGAGFAAGWQGNASATSLKNIPVWAWCAVDDDYQQIGNTRALVSSLRRAGANLVYTEYASGAHVGGIIMGHLTPALVDWFLTQRRGVPSTAEPLLTITSPTQQAVLPTGATNLSLAGSAAALGRAVTVVTWTNFANNAQGLAAGTNLWSATNIPLVANRANIVVVVGATTSWAPAYGGSTSFNDALIVNQTPLRATLVWQGANALLNWTGGGPPYCVQTCTNLTVGDWVDLLTNATPPVTLWSEGQTGFYRIVGQ